MNLLVKKRQNFFSYFSSNSLLDDVNTQKYGKSKSISKFKNSLLKK